VFETEVACEVCQTLCSVEHYTCTKCGAILPHRKQQKTVGISEEVVTDMLRFNTGTSMFGRQFTLRLHLETGERLTVQFEKQLVLGRMISEGEDYIDFTKYNGHEHGISRLHARIVRYPMTLLIQDLGSTNGTFLNGSKLDSEKGAVLRDGDSITLGKFQMRVEFISSLDDDNKAGK
jgi:hypothetical protein